MLDYNILDSAVEKVSQEPLFKVLHKTSQMLKNGSLGANSALENIYSKFTIGGSFYDFYRAYKNGDVTTPVVDLMAEYTYANLKVGGKDFIFGSFFGENKLDKNELECAESELDTTLKDYLRVEYVMENINRTNFIGMDEETKTAAITQMRDSVFSEFNKHKMDFEEVLSGDYTSLGIYRPVEVEFEEVNDGKTVGFDYYDQDSSSADCNI